jgi:phosphoenolpyruvate---glycerone phosphotransferase subunit DhaL
MSPDPSLLKSMIAAAAVRIIDAADELTALDQAIGDGDHGINMKRGCEQVLAELDAIAAKPTGEALKAVGMALVMKVGGASGPLYGSLFMSMGKKLGERPATIELLPEVFAAGVEAVAARGKSTPCEKTMLDVLTPVLEAMRRGEPVRAESLREAAARGAASTIPMRATKGRASFLGERSIGHMDPGARSSQIMIEALSAFLEQRTRAKTSPSSSCRTRPTSPVGRPRWFAKWLATKSRSPIAEAIRTAASARTCRRF